MVCPPVRGDNPRALTILGRKRNFSSKFFVLSKIYIDSEKYSLTLVLPWFVRQYEEIIPFRWTNHDVTYLLQIPPPPTHTHFPTLINVPTSFSKYNVIKTFKDLKSPGSLH